MQYIEELSWILDDDVVTKPLEQFEAACKKRIAFVHSLNLKCDSIGWSNLNLADPRADEILAAIRTYCQTNGCRARGTYTRTYTNVESDWYELVLSNLNDNTLADYVELESEQGGRISIADIRAYRELRPTPKWIYDGALVPERFRNACLRHGITDLDFCWAQDRGKYAAEQYFYAYGNVQIAHILTDSGLKLIPPNNSEAQPANPPAKSFFSFLRPRRPAPDPQKEIRDRIQALGGCLPKVADVFETIWPLSLQSCYLAADMPSGGIACAYRPKNFSDRGEFKILIHKDTAQILLAEKALTPASLRPAVIVDTIPGGYVMQDTFRANRPTATCIELRLAAYEKQKATARPVRAISEKDALKLLRSAKRERKEDFNKAMPKAAVAALLETAYACLAPYYAVADGGYLSDEYEFLSYKAAIAENALFFEAIQAEELLDETPSGVVFGKCPDGDVLLLCADNRVFRFSHEEPVATAEWPSLAQFFADTTTEPE